MPVLTHKPVGVSLPYASVSVVGITESEPYSHPVFAPVCFRAEAGREERLHPVSESDFGDSSVGVQERYRTCCATESVYVSLYLQL